MLAVILTPKKEVIAFITSHENHNNNPTEVN
jgi:hypothetical protein